MSTSVKSVQKHLLNNLAASIFLAFAGAVYECFGHGVYSYYMIYAFAFPLVMGVGVYTILLIKGKYPGRMFMNLWGSAIASLSLGSVFAGVLAIAGYTNSLIYVYQIAGFLLALAGIVAAIFKPKTRLFAEETDDGDDTAD